jgi:30S ribosomal protein S31
VFIWKRFCIFAAYFSLIKKIITMGRGDNRTKKGKIFSGTFGVVRPAKSKKTQAMRAAKKAKA